MDSVEIKNLRKELGMTLVEFSELLGVTKRTVINYEQGKLFQLLKINYFNLLEILKMRRRKLQKF